MMPAQVGHKTKGRAAAVEWRSEVGAERPLGFNFS